MKRRRISCLMILLLAFMTGGCGSKTEKKMSGIRVGVTLYDQYDTFIAGLLDAFLEDVAKKENEAGISINVEVFNASLNQSVQNEQVENMIKDGCDVICVNLVDRTAPTRIIDLAEKNNVPIIFFNRELVEEDLERWDQLFYIGANAFESGIIQGEQAADIFLNDPSSDRNHDGICQYIVLEGEAGHQDAFVRTEYSVKTMQEKGVEMEKLGYGIANWRRAQGQSKMSQMLSQYGDSIELVLANNDDMAVGAVDALKEAQIAVDQWPIILGIDGTRDAIEAVKNGEMRGTVFNDHLGQADAMLELAYRIAAGEDTTDMNLIDGKYIRLPYSGIGPDDVKK